MARGVRRAAVVAFRPDTLWIVFLAVAYFLAQELALLLPDAQKVVAAVWPAGGIGLAALLLSSRRRWPAILLILFLVGNGANLLSGRPFLASVGFMTAHVMESLACAWLVSLWYGEGVRFSRVGEVLALIVCATVVNACTSLLGAGTATLTHTTRFWETWLTWWVAAGLGILLVTPLIVTWSDFLDWFGGLRWERTLESGSFLAVWCAAGWWTFQPAAHFDVLTPRPYMFVGLLAWPALRLGQRVVTLALVVLGAMTVTSKAVSAGPLLWGGADPIERLLAVQVWLWFTAATGLLLTASYAETQSAERRSSEERTRLRALGDNLPNGMVYQIVREFDGSMRFLYVSTGVQLLTGISPDEALLDASVLDRQLVEEVRPAFAAAVQASARDMSVFDMVVSLRRRDGEVRWMHMSSTPRLLPDGRILWDGILMDISDRKRAEAAMEEEVVRRRILFEQSKDGIVVLDLDGKLQETNQAFADMLGYTQEEMRELHVWDWNAQWTREELLSKLADLFAVAATFETRHRRKDGSFYEVEVSTSGAEFGGHKFLYSVSRDITGRKAAEAALRESRRLEGIGILAGGMAHEFNNLLTVINGYSGLLLRGFDIHDPVREQIDAIRVAGERAANLTQQLLAFGRKQIIRPRVLDLNIVVERSRPAWMPLLRPNIRLRMDLTPSAGLVSLDPDQIREVLVNLVKNAVDALPHGGELAIGTAGAQIGEEYATRHADAHSGQYAMLSVADTGVGMDEKTRAHVFEPFFTTKGRAVATGLGLATVHGSVAQHRGWITVESALGKGSVFKIYLPRVGECAEPDASAVSLSGKPDRRATILVVQEEEAVRRLTVSILRAHGYKTLEAANGGQAIAAVEGQPEPIHLILTDVILPGMTGRELAEQLKPRMPATKVLYVSGYPEDAIASYGVVAGDCAFMQKPYSPDLLVAKVGEILDSE